MDKRDIKIYDGSTEQEKWLAEILDRVKFVYDNDHQQTLLYQVDSEVLFEDDPEDGTFWVNYGKVYSVFESRFSDNWVMFTELCVCMVWKRLNKKIGTPLLIN